ncbi:MAG: hypothetical protein RMJ43_03935 [Chloroherpetonaceae bacterium]|nr:hypothetical protein [Chloroherpetonaceae bacterium]
MPLETLPVLRIAREAAAQLPPKTCAAINAAGLLTTAATGGADFAGAIIENDGATTPPHFALLQTAGIAVLLSDGTATITPGNLLTVGTGGRIRPVTPASGTTLRGIIGRALTAAAATADLEVQVLLQPHIYIGA